MLNDEEVHFPMLLPISGPDCLDVWHLERLVLHDPMAVEIYPMND